jgi:hypothetical protein
MMEFLSSKRVQSISEWYQLTLKENKTSQKVIGRDKAEKEVD